MHSIRMYWTNFRQLNAHVQQHILGKTLIEVCSLHLLAPFASKLVNYSRQWVFKHSEEFRNRWHFPKNFYCTWAVGSWKFVQYIHMLCTGWFILVESVDVFEGKSRRFRNSSECLKTHCAGNNWPIWTQKVPKEA